MVLAIDPGRAKCGLAVVARSGLIRHREIVSCAELRRRVGECLRRYPIRRLILGRGTGHREVLRELQDLGIPLTLVDEAGTTLEARRRYFEAHPPRGWRRWVPRGLLIPPEPYDDWVAVLLAERYWAAQGEDFPTSERNAKEP
jgi:RNase H-fold protein (predicted Holliday junction resolvase)